MKTLVVFVKLIFCMLCLHFRLVAGPPENAVPLVRFFDVYTNEHCYSAMADEQTEWRKKASALNEQNTLGLVATKPFPNSKRLYRHLPMDKGRTSYSFSESLDPNHKIDTAKFEIYVWREPGDGRIPIYCSTWIDGTDVFLESDLETLEEHSSNTRKVNGVIRLRPSEGPMFYIYPFIDKLQRSTAQVTTTSNNSDLASTGVISHVEDLIATNKDTVVNFEELQLDNPVTSFDMTEDGRFLVISHQAQDLLSVYDILQSKVVTIVKCKSPRSVMCRGNRVFVANYGHGTISVFTRDRDFVLIDSLQVEKPNIVHISAAMGNYFGNELIVTSQGNESQASYRDSHVYVVDINKDRFRRVGGDALASVSADGRVIITQGSFNSSPSGDIRAYNFKDFVSPNGRGDSLYGGGVQQTPFVYQIAPGNFWLSHRVILGGIPIGVAMPAESSLIIPDYSQKLVYSINEDVVKSHLFGKDFHYIEMRRARYPAKFKDFSKVNQHHYRMCSYLLDHPVAYVHADRLHMFVLTGEGGNGVMLTANTPAFIKNDPSEKTGRSSSNSIMPLPQDVNTNNSPLDEQLKNSFPKVISAGTTFSYHWNLAKPGNFEMLSDIPNLTLTASGSLEWKVSPDQIGKHELKIRIGQAAENVVERLSVEVVDARLMSATGGDLSRLSDYQRINLDADSYFVNSDLKNEKMLLLQGDVLTGLAGNGFEIEYKLKLPKRYKYVFDRGTHLLAISSEDGFALESIDKESMKVTRSIDLTKTQSRIHAVTDMAINPTCPISYIAVHLENEMPHHSVLTVDETTGEVQATGIFGTWVQVSPDGQQIYTGYKDIFRKGTSFQMDPEWKIIDTPEFGNVDMLLCWDTSRTAKLKQAIQKPGVRGTGIRLSPDGRRIAYLSFTGDPKSRGDLVGWNTKSFNNVGVRYALRDRGSASELAFHPRLPMIAVPGGTSAILFDQENGNLLKDKLILPTSGLSGVTIDRLYFSSDGKHLLFLCSGQEGRYIRSVDLNLTPSELVASQSKSVQE